MVSAVNISDLVINGIVCLANGRVVLVGGGRERATCCSFVDTAY